MEGCSFQRRNEILGTKVEIKRDTETYFEIKRQKENYDNKERLKIRLRIRFHVCT